MLAFTTISITPLYSYEGEQLSKGFIKKLDPTRKLKKLIKELESFSNKTSVEDLKDFIQSFKSFAEEQTGTRISSDDLYHLFRNKVAELKLPIDPRNYKFLFKKSIRA